MGVSLYPARLARRGGQFIRSLALGLGGLLAAVQPVVAAGPVIINEVMPDPLFISDLSGEWIELYNSGSVAVDIEGWKIAEDTEEEVIDDSVVVPSRGVALLCSDAYPDLNGGLNCDYEFSDFSIDNGSNSLTLKRPALSGESGDADDPDFVSVDSLAYDAADADAGSSLMPDRQNGSLEPTLDEDDEQEFTQDDQNEYTDDNTGTPGELTLADLIDTRVQLSLFDALVEVAADGDCDLADRLRSTDTDDGQLTVFAPSDGALNALPTRELQELVANPDELCEFLAYHVVASDEALLSTDISTTPTPVATLSGDIITSMVDGDDRLVLRRAGSVTADAATVTTVDLMAANGVAHIVNGVLLPQNPALTINPVKTSSSSPELSGTFNTDALDEFPGVCILVRVGGEAFYPALVSNAGTWSVPAGVVDVSFSQSQLFTVVMRAGDPAAGSEVYTCDETLYDDLENTTLFDEEFSAAAYGAELLGLTMSYGVVSKASVEPVGGPTTLGPTTPPRIVTVSTATDTAVAGEQDEGEQTEEEPAPTDGQESAPTDDADDDQSSTWYWWFIGAGTVALVWYALWRRQEEAA